jgi:hypothetical protein
MFPKNKRENFMKNYHVLQKLFFIFIPFIISGQNLTGNEYFVDKLANDNRLAPNSPLIDAGTDGEDIGPYKFDLVYTFSKYLDAKITFASGDTIILKNQTITKNTLGGKMVFRSRMTIDIRPISEITIKRFFLDIPSKVRITINKNEFVPDNLPPDYAIFDAKINYIEFATLPFSEIPDTADTAVVDAIPDNVPPSAVKNVNTTSIGGNKVNITWELNTELDVRRYKVYKICKTCGQEPIQVASVKPQRNYFLDTAGDLTNYYYEVVAYDQVGNQSKYYTKTSSTANLTKNKCAIASSVEKCGVEPEKAVDGDKCTRWSSGFSDAQWIYIDMGEVHRIARVVIWWETAYGRAYDIQASINAIDWYTVYSTDCADGNLDEIQFASRYARYIKMNGRDRGTQWGYSIYEFEVFENQSPWNANAQYKILARHSGKAVEVKDCSTENGATIQQCDYHGGNSQKWKIGYIGDGYYKVINGNSCKGLDVKDWNTANGAIIQQWAYNTNGQANQEWKINNIGSSYYTLEARFSGKVIDIKDASLNNGAIAQQWSYCNQPNAQFRIINTE